MGLIGGIYSMAISPLQKSRGRQQENQAKNDLLKQKIEYNYNTNKFSEELQGQVDKAIQGRESVMNDYRQYASTGLSEESKSLYSDIANTGLATNIAATRDRRGGLVGIGGLQRSFLDNAREVSAMDAEIQRQKMQEALGYGATMQEQNTQSRLMPLQYQMNRSEGMEARRFSEIDANLDYARGMIGAGQQNMASGVDQIGNFVEQGAAMYLTGGLSGLGKEKSWV